MVQHIIDYVTIDLRDATEWSGITFWAPEMKASSFFLSYAVHPNAEDFDRYERVACIEHDSPVLYS
eukprot:6452327-Pyramimonas_sp.AAC.1